MRTEGVSSEAADHLSNIKVCQNAWIRSPSSMSSWGGGRLIPGDEEPVFLAVRILCKLQATTIETAAEI